MFRTNDRAQFDDCVLGVVATPVGTLVTLGVDALEFVTDGFTELGFVAFGEAELEFATFGETKLEFVAISLADSVPEVLAIELWVSELVPVAPVVAVTVPGTVATAGSDSAPLPVAAAVPLLLAAAFVVSVGAVAFVLLAVAGGFGAGLLFALT